MQGPSSPRRPGTRPTPHVARRSARPRPFLWFAAAALLVLAALGAHVLTRWRAEGPRVSPWTVGFGGEGYQWGSRVVVHGDGVIVAGIFTGTVRLGADSLGSAQQRQDVFVASFDLSGTPRWTRTLSEPGDQTSAELAVDGRGNVFVATNSEVSKLGRDGALLWNRALDGVRLVGAAVDARGRVVLAGTRREGRSGTADEDAVVVKLDAAGNDLWTRRIGGPLHQSATAIAADRTGAIVLAGNFAGDTDVAGVTLHSEGTGLLNSDTFLARLTDSGAADWAVAVPISIRSIATGRDGRVVAVGSRFPDRDKTYSNPGRRAAVAQFDRRGRGMWEREFDAGVEFNDVAVADDGSVFAVGRFDTAVRLDSIALTTAGDQDILVVRLDQAGDVRGAERFGGPQADYAVGVATDAAANVVVTGAASGQIDFASGSVVGGGQRNAFVSSFTLGGRRSADRASPAPAPAAAPAAEAGAWTSSFGSASGQVSALATDAAGSSLFASGQFSGSLVWGDIRHVGRGRSDVHVTKLDASGRIVWSRAFGDDQVQDAPSLSVDADGSVYCGFEDRPSDVAWPESRVNGRALVKVSSAGEEVWRYRYEDYGSHPPAFAAIPDATVILARSSAASTQLTQLDRTSKEAWSRGLDPRRFQHVECLARSATGDLAMTGASAGPHATAFVLATDRNGGERWSRELGGNHWPANLCIAAGPAGEVLVGGAVLGELRLPGVILPSGGTGTGSFVAMFDASGRLAWAERFAGANRLHALLVRPDGSAVVAGEFEGSLRFGTSSLQSVGSADAFVVVFDPTGVVRGARRFGGAEPDTIYAVAEADGGRLIVAGATAGSIDFPGGIGRGTFIASLAP